MLIENCSQNCYGNIRNSHTYVICLSGKRSLNSSSKTIENYYCVSRTHPRVPPLFNRTQKRAITFIDIYIYIIYWKDCIFRTYGFYFPYLFLLHENYDSSNLFALQKYQGKKINYGTAQSFRLTSDKWLESRNRSAIAQTEMNFALDLQIVPTIFHRDRKVCRAKSLTAGARWIIHQVNRKHLFRRLESRLRNEMLLKIFYIWK